MFSQWKTLRKDTEKVGLKATCLSMILLTIVAGDSLREQDLIKCCKSVQRERCVTFQCFRVINHGILYNLQCNDFLEKPHQILPVIVPVKKSMNVMTRDKQQTGSKMWKCEQTQRTISEEEILLPHLSLFICHAPVGMSVQTCFGFLWVVG